MKSILSILIIFCCISTKAQKDTAKVTANIKEATVYFGYGAELTHDAKVAITKNTRYIIIDKVSTQIDLNSLQISCPESISLLSQQFSLFTPAPKPTIENPMVKKIVDSINQKNKLLLVFQSKIDIDQTVLSSTDKLIQSTIATSNNKTAITTEVLKLIDFLNAKIEKNKQAIFDNQQKMTLIREEIAALNERLSKLNQAVDEVENDVTENKTATYGRIVLQVVCRADEQAPIALSYYTRSAGWQPIYDIRVNSKTNAIKLVYKASVIQNTGINWVKTKLTLSTGTPNFTTEAPVFNPWYLQIYVPQLYAAVQGKVAGVSMSNSIQAFDDNMLKKERINADADKSYELSEVKVTPSTLNNFTNLQQGLLNTSFEIDLPYDIESNGLAHSINIKEENVQSNLKNYAVPKLDGEAYLLAELTNWQNFDLIPGNANIIMDDTYIGKSFIDPNTTADTLNLSLGKDKRVAIKRTLVKDASTTKTKDAFTKQTFTYELVVKNNKLKEVNMILKDQYPLSNVKEIEVELVDNGNAAVNTELGVLNWQFTLKPGEVKKVRFSYTVKYPKDKKIANLK